MTIGTVRTTETVKTTGAPSTVASEREREGRLYCIDEVMMMLILTRTTTRTDEVGYLGDEVMLMMLTRRRKTTTIGTNEDEDKDEYWP